MQKTLQTLNLRHPLRQAQRTLNVNLPDERVAAKRGDSGAVEDMRHLIEARIVKKMLRRSEIAQQDMLRVKHRQLLLGDVELTHVLFDPFEACLGAISTHEQ